MHNNAAKDGIGIRGRVGRGRFFEALEKFSPLVLRAPQDLMSTEFLTRTLR